MITSRSHSRRLRNAISAGNRPPDRPVWQSGPRLNATPEWDIRPKLGQRTSNSIRPTSSGGLHLRLQALGSRAENGSGSTGNRLSVLLRNLVMSSGESLTRGAYVVCTALALRIGRRRFGARLGGRLFFIASTGTRGGESCKAPEGSRLHSEKYSIFASFRQLLRGMPCLNRPSFPEERPTHHGRCCSHSPASLFWPQPQC